MERSCSSKERPVASRNCACWKGSLSHGERMSIEEITARICAFRDAREWMVFHNPKEMAVAIAAEAGELMQPFVWKSAAQSEEIAQHKKAEIRDEIADVAMLLFEMAHNLDISLEQAILDKLERNEVRYPVAKARGSNAKYNEL